MVARLAEEAEARLAALEAATGYFWDADAEIYVDLCDLPAMITELQVELANAHRARGSLAGGDHHRPSHAASLREWRRQLAAGERNAKDVDALFRAAGAEQLALECEHDGLLDVASHYWADARRTLTEAAALAARRAA